MSSLRQSKRSNLYSLSTIASFVFECGSWLYWYALSYFVMIKRWEGKKLIFRTGKALFPSCSILFAVSSIEPFTSQILTAASSVKHIISKTLDIDILQIMFHISFVQWTLYCNLFNLDQLGIIWKWTFSAARQQITVHILWSAHYGRIPITSD